MESTSAGEQGQVTIEIEMQHPATKFKEDIFLEEASTSNANIPLTPNGNESADPSPLSQQRPVIPVWPSADQAELEEVPLTPKQRTNLPCEDLITGPKEEYIEFGLGLYDASIKCCWEDAEKVLNAWEDAKNNVHDKPELLRCSITQNGETALHIAASAKGPKKVVEFVQKLVDKMVDKNNMEENDLAIINKDGDTALYLAAAAGNLETVNIMLEKNRALLTIPGSNGTMMPLYVAAKFGNKDVVRRLYDLFTELHFLDKEYLCALLEECVECDMFDFARHMLNGFLTDPKKISILRLEEDFPEIVKKSSILGVLARKPEAFREKKRHSVSSFFRSKEGDPENDTDAMKLLSEVWSVIGGLPNDTIDDILRGPPDSSDSGRVIHTIRLENHLDIFKREIEQDEIQMRTISNPEYVLKMHDVIQASIKEYKTASGKGDFLELQKLISEYIVQIRDETESYLQLAHTAHKLRELILEHINKLREDTKPKHSSRVLFVAAEAGNTRFLVELFRLRPDLMREVDDNNQTIFHIAVKHRHQDIYNLLYEIGSMKDVTPLKDRQNNNMLHLVGMIAKPKRLEEVSGPALQVQRELLWFQKVQGTIPPSCKDQKNEDDLTPHELFTKEHEDLVTQAEKWMKGAANQGMVVAALIATIVFAAAFTVPGGYAQSDEEKTNHKIGIPVFYSNTSFMVFIVADAISLFASSASIFIFLSIRTSRYAECDFLESIPNKLMAALATLFIAIATMTLSFGASFFVLYKKDLLWIPIFIGVFGFLPIILYMCLQFRLFSDTISSINASKNLFKPKEHVLNYGNLKPKKQDALCNFFIRL